MIESFSVVLLKMEKYYNIRSAKDIINTYYGSIIALEDETRLFNSNMWKKIVGKGIADHAQPLAVERDVLLLKVDHPAWKQHIQFQSSKILTDINRVLPKSNINTLKITLTKDAH